MTAKYSQVYPQDFLFKKAEVSLFSQVNAELISKWFDAHIFGVQNNKKSEPAC